jgi:hypothetical protein
MGASGKRLAGHGARSKSKSPPAQSKDGGYGLPPHPAALRPGQRYAPRSGKMRGPFQIVRIDRLAARAIARRVEGDREFLNITARQLLALRGDGQGRHYQLQGFAPRRYRTYAVVVVISDDRQAVLVLPEWHPARPVHFPTRLLPSKTRSPGAWLRCTADLSQGRPAQLNLADLVRCDDPGPDICHRSAYLPPNPGRSAPPPSFGPGCGDIVLELPFGLREVLRSVPEHVEIVVPRRAPGLRPGARIYIAEDGRVDCYLQLVNRRLLPNGDRLLCKPESASLSRPIAAPGPCEQHRWRWRWWNRNEEGDDGTIREIPANEV